jgi:hypothetical protein
MQSIRTAPGPGGVQRRETLPARKAESHFALQATSAVRALDRVRQRAAAKGFLLLKNLHTVLKTCSSW